MHRGLIHLAYGRYGKTGCLSEVYGLEDHMCGGLDCVKRLVRQHKQLMILAT